MSTAEPSPPSGPSEDALANRLDDLALSTTSASETDPIMTPTASTPSESPNWETLAQNQDSHDALSMAAVDAALENISLDPPAPAGPNTPSTPISNQVYLAPDPATSSANPSRRRRSSRLDQPRHEPQDEQPPDDRFHDPEFQQALAEARHAMVELKDVLSTNSLHHEPDTIMQRLFDEVQALGAFRCPSTRTVGFVGDSGVGKSSLLNSLLDMQGFARASNSGAACTCVVTEYRFHDSQDFSLVVEWFTIDEIQQQLTDLLSFYRHFHTHGDELSGDEREHFEKRAQIAHDTVKAMFRDLIGDDIDEWLADDPEREVLSVFMTWVRALALPRASGPSTERFPDATTCSTRLMELTSEPIDPGAAAQWPFIKKIRVHLNAHILASGLILVDLPGLHDLNTARRNITERHLLQVDEILAVCAIGRATTDAGVAAVFDLASQANLSNVGIVCTKSDDIRAEECLTDWDGERKRGVERRLRIVDQHKTDLTNLEMSISYFLDGDDPDDLSTEEHRELAEMDRRAARIRARLSDHQFELKRYMITTRNHTVTQSLALLYRDHSYSSGAATIQHPVPIFCISNAEYWSHRDAPRDAALPLLRLSGILDMRRHCIAIISTRQLDAARVYMDEKIPAALTAVQLWVQSGAGTRDAERRELVREALERVERRLTEELTFPGTAITDMENQMVDAFGSNISQNLRNSAWSTAAGAAATKWHGWHHSSYAAFCRQYGDYETQVAGRHCWNRDIMATMVRDTTTCWQALLGSLRSVEGEVLGSVHSTLNWAVDLLRTELGSPDSQLDALIQMLGHRHCLLRSEIRGLFDQWDGDLLRLHVATFSPIRTSIVGQIMEPAYNQSQYESGRGSDARRKHTIESKANEVTFFPSWHREFRTQFLALAAQFQEKFVETVTSNLRVICENIGILKEAHAAEESERDPEFRERVERGVARAEERWAGMKARLETMNA